MQSRRAGNNEAHLRWLRTLPCPLCKRQGIRNIGGEVHHLMQPGQYSERGMGMKSEDIVAMPICRGHHTQCHAEGSKHEENFFRAFNIEAHALWVVTTYAKRSPVEAIRKEAERRLALAWARSN